MLEKRLVTKEGSLFALSLLRNTETVYVSCSHPLHVHVSDHPVRPTSAPGSSAVANDIDKKRAFLFFATLRSEEVDLLFFCGTMFLIQLTIYLSAPRRSINLRQQK